MKLDVDVLRYLSKDDFRVLTAVEMGMRNVCFLPLLSSYTIIELFIEFFYFSFVFCYLFIFFLKGTLRDCNPRFLMFSA